MNEYAIYHLGCPVWHCHDWAGSVFEGTVDSSQALREYSKILNTVEANSIFYAVPLYRQSSDGWPNQRTASGSARNSLRR